MRLRLLAAAALVLGVLAGSAHATPGGSLSVAPARAFVLDRSTGSGFERVEVSLWQTQAAVDAGQASGALTGRAWHACVFAWLHRSFFSSCGTPTAVTVSVPMTGASGSVAF